MKRMILGISVLLMFTQNGLAKSVAEWDKMITNESDLTWKQVYHCNKAANNNPKVADVNDCLKAVRMINNGKYKNSIDMLANVLLNAGLIYDESGDDLNGYKYYMKAAKVGGKHGISAQNNLNIMCKESPWACK